MIDMEKVIKGLEKLRKDLGYGLPDRSNVVVEYLNSLTDAIELLKEQEAREPHYTTLRYLVNGMEMAILHPECPRCIEKGLMLWDAEIQKGQPFCKRCGQAVKWND